MDEGSNSAQNLDHLISAIEVLKIILLHPETIAEYMVSTSKDDALPPDLNKHQVFYSELEALTIRVLYNKSDDLNNHINMVFDEAQKRIESDMEFLKQERTKYVQ